MIVIGKLQAARDSIRLLSLALGLSPKVGKSQRWWRAGYKFLPIRIFKFPGLLMFFMLSATVTGTFSR